MGEQVGGIWDALNTDPLDYDAVEVQACADVGFDGVIEVVDEEDAEFWSAYAHLKGGGVECIGDFDTRQEAVDYANSIANRYGWRTTS